MLASTFSGLYVLVALACPVGMGVMMLFMGKGMRGTPGPRSQVERPPEPLAALKAEQARLAEKISKLERRGTAEDEGDEVGKALGRSS